MTHQEFTTWATSHGWTTDRFGHMHKAKNGARFHMSKIYVRLDRKTESGQWVRVRGNYLAYLSLTPEGKLSGMTTDQPGFPPKTKEIQ